MGFFSELTYSNISCLNIGIDIINSLVSNVWHGLVISMFYNKEDWTVFHEKFHSGIPI